jgi:hypothetical protein
MALTVPNTFVAGTTAVASEVNDNFVAIKVFVDGLETDVAALEIKSPVITLAGDLTGSATLTNLGNATLTATIAPNSVALGTDTTGNYVSDVASGTGITVTHTPGEGSTPTVAVTANTYDAFGAASTAATNAATALSNHESDTTNIHGIADTSILVTTSGTQTLTNKTLTSPTITGVSPVVTLSGDVTGSATLTNLGSATITATIAANSVALGTDTTGNYVSTITAGTGITGSASSESATPTIAIDAAVVPQLGVANTFTTNQVIAASSASDLLRITQTGSGNALVVEDSTNPDSTPFVVDSSGQTIIGSATAVNINGTPQFSVLQTVPSIAVGRFSNDAGYPRLKLSKSRSGTIGTNTTVQSGDSVGTIEFLGADGTSYVRASEITSAVDGTPGTNDMPGRLVFSTTADGSASPTERMRIDSAGRVGIGVAGPLANLHILAGTATGVSPAAGGRLFIDGNNANMWIDIAGSTTSEVGLRFGDSGAIQRGRVGYSNTSDFLDFFTAGLERMRIDSSGQVGIGTVPTLGTTLHLGKNHTGATTTVGLDVRGAIQGDVTLVHLGIRSQPSVAASVAMPTIYLYSATGSTLGAGASLTAQGGFVVQSSMTQATSNYGFWGALASATGRWNLYMSGSAANYMAGRLGVGATLTSGAMAQITNTTAADKALVVKGAASQTGYLTDWQNSSGTSLAYVDSSGSAKFVSIDGGSA